MATGRLTYPVALIFAVVVAWPVVASGQSERSPYDEDVLREARTVYKQIMSPYCPGQTLENCGSGAAEILRGKIRERIAAGESPDEIIQSLIEEFGEEVQAEPPKSGFASLVWLGPIFLLISGAFVIAVYVKRNTATGRGQTLAGDTGVRARVEEELKSHRD
ncbi:MAG: cytochrome c-type biogenesis protein CcmH [Candidatus Latescibacterota bacterium]|jgi:cytochrome c-type biogenesis protein CcmH